MTEALPGILQEIADAAGDAAALVIASRAGGTRVYIPAKVTDAHWLVECVGREAAEKLCNHFMVDGRGQRIEIPLHVGGSYRQLQRAIAKRIHEMDAGDEASSSKIARVAGVTQRTVHRHRARHTGSKAPEDKKPKQGRLL
jgi:hypothetical protein